jgi:hypothetical protein
MKRVLVGTGVAAGLVLYDMWRIFRERGFF